MITYVPFTDKDKEIKRMFNLLKTLSDSENKNKKLDSLPVLLGLEYDENFISSYLACLLDPSKIMHGKIILENIIKKYGINSGIETSIDINEISVIREYYLSEESRIDIWIEYKHLPLIVIENKVFSQESVKNGTSQTKRYTEEITSKIKEHSEYKPICFLLSPDGRKPRQPDGNLFVGVSYKDFRQIIVQGLDPYKVPSDEYYIIYNFIKYVNDKFMTESIQIKGSEKEFIENYTTIKSIEKSVEKHYENAIIHIKENLKSKYSDTEFKYEWNPKRSWQQIFKESWNTGVARVHLEFIFDQKDLLVEGKYQFAIHVEKDADQIVLKKLKNGISDINILSKLEENGFKFPQNSSFTLIQKEINRKNFNGAVENIEKDLDFIYTNLKEIISILDSFDYKTISTIC